MYLDKMGILTVRGALANMNESTFEAQAHKAIQQIFPKYVGLELNHQLIFPVKVGHDYITIRPNIKKPRLDILIKQKERNLAVLELKKPGHPLTDEDRDQGLSYAGLIRPNPPLVIVSNGEQTRIYETITGEVLNLRSPDAAQIDKLFANALDIAADRKDEAIRTLLGKDQDIWVHVIEKLNLMGFQNHTGAIDTFYEPIAESFHLPRESANRIAQLVSVNNPVIAVTGAPLIGKTNVLYNLCKLKGMPFVPLYINAEDCVYGIFQYLANYFTEHFFSSTSVDDIRQWLLHGIVNNRHPAGKMVLIIDAVRSDSNLTPEIYELIDYISTSTSCSLLIACDSSNYDRLAKIPGRPGKTLFGKRAMRVEVEKLNDDEFLQAKKYLMERCSASFNNGAEYSKELRNPIILRMIVSRIQNKGVEVTEVTEDSENTEGIFVLIPSFLPFRFLDWVIRGFSDDPKFLDDMAKLVRASLENDSNSPSNIMESLVSYGRGHVVYDRAESILGEDRIERLLQQGHIDWFIDKELNRYIIPKVPELLAATAVEVLIKQARNMEFEKAIDYILSKCERLPYGDLIAANAFYRLSFDACFPFNDLIVRLVENRPQIEKVKSGFKGSMYFDKTGLVTLPETVWSESTEESQMFSNFFSWLVLSQLATQPMMLDDSEDQWAIYRQILLTVGGHPNILRRFDPVADPLEVLSYSTHEIISKSGVKGVAICGKIGIIEPITYAMQHGFYHLPEELLKVCQYAVNISDPFLCHRLLNAAQTMIDVTKMDSAKAAKQALRLLKDVHE